MKERAVDRFDKHDPLWRLTPFIDFPGEYGDTQYRFEWEREWRVPGDFTFSADDVAFLFLPEEHHQDVRETFEELVHDPEYIDPGWATWKLKRSFSVVLDSRP